MKLITVINITSVRRNWSRWALCLAVLFGAVNNTRLAHADGAGGAGGSSSYVSTRTMLGDFFPKSERVTFRTIAVDGALKERITQRLGYAPARQYTIFIATTAGTVDGYAIVDDQLGEHQPITFATKLSPRAVVERVEILAYREPRGDEVRDARFRGQFVGKTSHDQLRLNRDIDAVTGATISSAATAVAVRRAAVLVEELMVVPTALASLGNPRDALRAGAH